MSKTVRSTGKTFRQALILRQ